ncbi:MAG: hypothetical protein FVQ81_12650 [Candidatus Glassbacteria bacterium]|nr:hypothetical protein [Candidatus Glassbacteria bacterium]
MGEMTTRERMRLTYEHREADRAPFFDFPWESTVERWHREGLPGGVRWEDHFGLDRVFTISVDNSPRYPVEILERTDEYTLKRTEWGVTLKQWNHHGGTPEFLDYTVTDRDSWNEARRRMTPSRDRIDWKLLEREYRACRERGDWFEALAWFGFDVTHSWMLGTERLLVALLEDPDWCREMFGHYLDTSLALLEMVWDAGYEFDILTWYDDLGFKQGQFISVAMYRELLKPYHQRAVEWAHRRGIRTRLHSCGDIRPFLPEFRDIGIDCLNPLEVKAGVDPLALKRDWGGELVLHGGLNAVLWDRPEEIVAEIERVVPVLKAGGGYIFASDHSIPDSVDFDTFSRIVETYKRVAVY